MSAEIWFISNGNVSCKLQNNIYGCCENPHAVHNFPCIILYFALVYIECKQNYRAYVFLRNNEFLLLFSANFDIILPRCPYLNLYLYYFETH